MAPAPVGGQMLHDYLAVAQEVKPATRQGIIDWLDATLPELWIEDYVGMTKSPTNILTIPFGDKKRVEHFVSYLFDQTSGHPDLIDLAASELKEHTHDRVVAVWGTSKQEPASTRPTERMKGFLKGVWSEAYPERDRGHFFAHTMGGSVDMNLFPQLSRINRTGLWREMETYCAQHPGTFCFIHPIYTDHTWQPARLEYGIYKLPPENPLTFWGNLFEN